MQPDKALVKSDASFHSYAYFKNYSITKDPWLYLTTQSSYIYAIGFNTARLLDKLNISYKERLFTDGDLSLEKYYGITNKPRLGYKKDRFGYR